MHTPSPGYELTEARKRRCKEALCVANIATNKALEEIRRLYQSEGFDVQEWEKHLSYVAKEIRQDYEALL